LGYARRLKNESGVKMILFKDATANGDYNEIELNGAFIGILQLDQIIWLFGSKFRNYKWEL